MALMSACSSSVDSPTVDTSLKKEIKKFESTPSIEYAKALNSAIVNLEISWKNSYESSRESLHSALDDIQIEVDESFSLVTITAEAGLDFEGDATDLRNGLWLGLDSHSVLDIAVFCAGKNDTGNDPFISLATDILQEIKGTYSTKVWSIGYPSKGVIFQMNWINKSYSIDKYGLRTHSTDPIGMDQIGISTENLKRMANPAGADLRELSDLVPSKFAKRSWYNGYCADSQRRLN